MLTKYYLEIDGNKSEVPQHCIKNWDEVKCAYKRSDYSGVTRSFTSQFEFVGEVRQMLIDLFLRDGFNASAELSLYTIDNYWAWAKQFSAPLDFSTLSWDNQVLKINCVDNSLASLIKGNKSIKYEFEVGKDIIPDKIFSFDRLTIKESLTYGFTFGESFVDCGDILVSCVKDMRVGVGNIGAEVPIGNFVEWNDDQEEEAESFLFEAKKDISVNVNYDLAWRSDSGSGSVNLSVNVCRGGVVLPTVFGNGNGNGGFIGNPGNANLDYMGLFHDYNELNTKYPQPKEGQYAVVDGYVWKATYMGYVQPNGTSYMWKNTGLTKEEYVTERSVGSMVLSLKAGDRVFIGTYFSGGLTSVEFRMVSSKIVFEWTAKGDVVDIPAFYPATVLDAVIKSIGGAGINAYGSISDHDPRLRNTVLMGGESIRGLSGAKLYTSFNDFCEWMEVVFGYTYCLGEPTKSKYGKIMEVGESFYSPWQYKDVPYDGEAKHSCIAFVGGHGRFFYHPEGTTDLYSSWSGSEDYNDPIHGYPRTDRLYRIGGKLYYFEEYSGSLLSPLPYEHGEVDTNKDFQCVNFVHRSEIFSDSSNDKKIANASDLSCSIDTSMIFSSVTIGYDKKDYDKANGRDEFNFNNTYYTGCPLSDKKLSMISKYRADSYGIEFTAQKRGEDTSDSQSDNNVFFVFCRASNGHLVPDRTVSIENALSKDVFNGVFSPMACLKANAGYIGMMAKVLRLRFASSTGNSSITVGGVSMSDSIVLDAPLVTCSVLEFSTDDMEAPYDINDIVSVTSDGMAYRGFVSEAVYKYAKNESVKYKLIIKDMLPC